MANHSVIPLILTILGLIAILGIISVIWVRIGIQHLLKPIIKLEQWEPDQKDPDFSSARKLAEICRNICWDEMGNSKHYLFAEIFGVNAKRIHNATAAALARFIEQVEIVVSNGGDPELYLIRRLMPLRTDCPGYEPLEVDFEEEYWAEWVSIGLNRLMQTGRVKVGEELAIVEERLKLLSVLASQGPSNSAIVPERAAILRQVTASLEQIRMNIADRERNWNRLLGEKETPQVKKVPTKPSPDTGE